MAQHNHHHVDDDCNSCVCPYDTSNWVIFFVPCAVFDFVSSNKKKWARKLLHKCSTQQTTKNMRGKKTGMYCSTNLVMKTEWIVFFDYKYYFQFECIFFSSYRFTMKISGKRNCYICYIGFAQTQLHYQWLPKNRINPSVSTPSLQFDSLECNSLADGFNPRTRITCIAVYLSSWISENAYL